MTGERPSKKLLIMLGLCVLLAGGVYGRMLFRGGEASEPEPDLVTGAVPYTTEPTVGTGDPGAWVLPDQPRDPFQAVPLGP